MQPSQLKGLYEAYNEVYAEKEDLIVDNLIEEIVEELIGECVEFGYEIEEAADVVENAAIEYLMELNPYAPAGSKEARAYAKSTTATKRGEERKAAIKSAVDRVKAKAKGAVASAGIAASIAKDEARRAGRAAAHTVSSTVQKKKAEVKSGVKGLIGRGLRAVAGGAGKVAQKAAGAASKFAEEIDIYNAVLLHLINEGYAETEEAALKIMANMGEEWRQEILDEAKYGTAAGRKALARKIRKGKNIGKKGPGTGFKAVEREAKKGGAEDPTAVAAAAMYKTYGGKKG